MSEPSVAVRLAEVDRIRFRATTFQAVMSQAVLVVVFGYSAIRGYGPPWWLWLFLTVAVLAFSWFGVTLTQTHALVHNLHRRRIAWSEIRCITRESFAGVPTIVLTEHSGRRTRLRFPSSGFLNWDRRFDDKYRTIGEWYLAHR